MGVYREYLGLGFRVGCIGTLIFPSGPGSLKA